MFVLSRWLIVVTLRFSSNWKMHYGIAESALLSLRQRIRSTGAFGLA